MDDLQPGVAVECRYRETPEFRSAFITATDGTRLTVAYDGGEETGVERRRARLPGQRQRNVLSVGDAVDAKHGSGRVLSATVASVAGEVYQVTFADATSQTLERRFVFGPWRDEPIASGTRVECRYRDAPMFYPGVVTSMDEKGLYAVKYDDGEADASVIGRRLRRPGWAQPPEVPVGARVDARRPTGGVRAATAARRPSIRAARAS